MNFKSLSQAGQDLFVYKLLVESGTVPIKRLTFLDIGCGGLEISNTYALELLGATGWLVDNSVDAITARYIWGSPTRTFLADATTLDYSFLPPVVDYLSLDVDAASLAVLKRLPLTTTRFYVITIEHDAWRFGDTLRIPMRQILKDAGYDLICEDVRNPDPFEDWWTDKSLWDKAHKFISSGKMWTDIFAEAEYTA